MYTDEVRDLEPKIGFNLVHFGVNLDHSLKNSAVKKQFFQEARTNNP